MTETKIKVRTTLGVTDHNLLDNRFIANQHTMNAISGLEEALESKQNILTAGENIEINEEGVISATDTTYTAGENVSIENGVISATGTTYTAGENVSIENGVISATDTTYTAGTGIDITNGVISNTQTSAEWGNIEGNINSQTDLKSALDAKANSADLATVATSGSYTDLSDKPTIADGILTIQKNGTTVDTFTANSTTNKTVNLVIPTTASDINAMPDSVKYAASITVAIDSTNYQVTTTLKDQDGNTLGTAQVIDLPLESVVVSGSYDSIDKNVILTLQNGSMISFSVADLVSGLQSEITSQNKLNADLVDDTTSVNKFVTASDKTTWNAKQDAISDLDTIRAGANAGATAVQAGDLSTVATSGSYTDLINKPTIPAAQVNSDWNAISGVAQILNKPSLATVATTGAYSDLTGTPTIPTVPENDDTTISLNAQDKLQAIGAIDKNSGDALGFWHGSQAEYDVGGGINPNETYYNWEYNNENWTSSNLGTSFARNDVVYGNGIYATNNNKSSLYSTDNQNWNESPTMNNSGFGFRLGFGNNIFVAYSANYTTGYYTSDFSNWVQTTIINLGYYPTELIYGNNKFVIISIDGKVAYSTDGITWNQSQQQLTGNSWSSLTFGNGRFVATGGALGAYSTDGETWEEVSLSNDSSDNFISVTFGDNLFVAISYQTNKLVYSQDGISWQNVTLPAEIDITKKKISFGNGLFIIYSYQTNSDTYYWYSKDLITWQKSSSTFPIKTIGVFSYVNNKFIVESNQQGDYVYGNIELNSAYTLDENPTTSSQVYDAPNTTSTLRITSVGIGTITLSDTNTYTYNANGNQNSYYSVGESYPNYICNIDDVGVKIGTTFIADYSAPAIGDIDTALTAIIAQGS